MPIRRRAGTGWLTLLGGGEFSFGETLEADRAWTAKAPEGVVGFLPAASGSTDYGRHFTAYMAESFERRVEVVPVYRARDARRRRNLERIEGAAAVYLGGGVADHLLAALAGSPAAEALADKLAGGGAVAAIAAAAQALGRVTRDLRGVPIAGLDWLPGGAVEANFSPAHDRRLRELLREPAVDWGLGLPSGSALLIGPDGEIELVGTAFVLEDADGDLKPFGES